MDLLTNAIESIQVGVEDYGVASRPRLLSAVRNIHAGILLLYKERLRRESAPASNEALLKAKVQPTKANSGTVTFVGVGKRTVDSQQIREHFESLGISTDWKRFGAISDLRNNIEHYYPNLTQDALRGLIASAFLIISRFMQDELGENARTLLGQVTWQMLLETADVYEAERNDCSLAIENIDTESQALREGIRRLRCDACGSDLLRPSDDKDLTATQLVCRACGVARAAEQFVPAAIAEVFEWESYLAVKDGDDSPYAECPECGTESYVLSEEGCAYCGASVSTDCARCGNPIPISEMSSAPFCGYCDHVMSKDD
jgi:hypothetical protein